MKRLLAASITALLLTGCAATSEPDAPAQEAASYPETYRSVVELKDAFVQAGGDCPSWEQTNQVKTASESGTCSPTNVLSIYTSEAEKEDALELFKSIAQPGAALLVGKNWIINDKSVKEIDPAIGGTFFTN